ncbi:MAG: response regulator [bacterium]
MKKDTRGLIYLCEDDLGIQIVVKEVLTDVGFTVLAYGSAEEMFAASSDVLPDLLIIDWWLPGLGGEKALERWRNDKETKAIPCLVMSAAVEIKKNALAQGADDFLAKPFNISELIITVNKLIGDRGSITYDHNVKN